MTGDLTPLYVDESYGAASRYRGRIAPGILTAGLVVAVLSTKMPGPGAILEHQAVPFPAPARPPPPPPYSPLKLERMRPLCALLDHPERHFPAVLVAGTKGKGSTAAMIAAMGAAAGFRAGLYTKPHLVDFRERIRINGELITPREVTALMAEVPAAIAHGAGRPGWPPTYFEVAAVLAFLHFARRAVDLAVVEGGIGGRLGGPRPAAAGRPRGAGAGRIRSGGDAGARRPGDPLPHPARLSRGCALHRRRAPAALPRSGRAVDRPAPGAERGGGRGAPGRIGRASCRE